ncbi:hypothetical protein CERSUDRAFT_91831 [Gelatoporia subvermispora B]|uniref:Major facilitator superfamily (MFS) profile domain-containing protein n=1 Tax=Ceriporiopsis subvermispora (strain B) TaxID=914234 RepID=M2R9I1_CERS8|nr:hypothetical protein CERSUDRAFT_91831 [Gelatoporia subvermispora B]
MSDPDNAMSDLAEEMKLSDYQSVARADYGDEALRLVGKERTQEFSEEYNKKLRRKLDTVIPPICALVYFTQYLLVRNGFLVFGFPTVYVSQKLRVAKYLGGNVILWGIILMLHAVTTSFGGFFALRFLLGMCESCVAPVLILIISMFYKKDEQATRVSWFYVTLRNRQNGLAQIFGGFVAYAISFYEGNLIPPYKIVYLVLGGLAIGVGTVVIVWLPDSPVHARILAREERIAALERVRDDQGGTENRRLKKDQILEALLDIRTWLIVLTTLMTSIPIGALGSFSNIIIKGFGYTYGLFNVLVRPNASGAVAAISTLICGWYSDRKGERMVPIVFALVPAIVGWAVMIGLNGKPHGKGALLFGTYLVNTFGSALSSVYAYNASNTSGHTKKNTINAITLVSFALGNIIGTEVFQPKDAPAYIPGKIAIMVLLIAELFIAFLLRSINVRLNTGKRARLAEEQRHHGWTESEVQKERERHEFLDLTDKQNIFFMYTA